LQAPVLRFLNSWSSFVADWEKQNANGRQLVDFETYTVGTKTRYAGMYEKVSRRSGGYFLWHNVDYESFKGAERYTSSIGLYLTDLELQPGQCSTACSNNVIADSSYNYKLTGDTVWYR